MHWAVAPHLPSCLFIPVEMQWVGHTVVACVQKPAMQQEASWHQPAIELYKCLSPFSVFLAHFSTDYAEVEICFYLAGHLYVLLITAPLMQYVPQAPVLIVLLWGGHICKSVTFRTAVIQIAIQIAIKSCAGEHAKVIRLVRGAARRYDCIASCRPSMRLER